MRLVPVTFFLRGGLFPHAVPARVLLLLSLSSSSLLLVYLFFPWSAQGVSTGVVISQVYGGGGNSGAVYKNDFVELFNRGNAPVSLNGWSVQYVTAASINGTSWTVFTLPNVTLQPGQYFLLQLGAGGGGTTNLPTPDATASTNIATSAGKVAVVSNATALTVACPSGSNVIDLVGYGSTANCSEGATAPGPSNNTTAILRALNGCTDTDSNSTDFATGTPNPRNTATTKAPCVPPAISIDDPMITEGNSGTQLLTFTVSLSYPAPTGGVKFDYATMDNTATTANNDYVAAAQANTVIAAGNNSAEIKITINGDLAMEADETFYVDLSNVTNATISKSRGTGTIKNDDSPPTATVSGSSGICPGDNATIQATLTGSSPWNLTWSDGVTQTGVTTNPVTRSVSPAMTTTYAITAISNQTGSGTATGSATITINPVTAIVTQPQAVAACTGQAATFSVSVTGAGLTYQWRKGATDIPGATNSTYTIASVTTADAAAYSVVVKGCGTVTSNAATLTVRTPLAITTQPTDQIVALGATPTFTVITSGTTPVTAQWQLSTDSGATWNNIAGATSTTLTLPAATLADNGKQVRAQLTNACNMLNSNTASLTVLAGEARILDPLVCIGDGTTLNVHAEIKNTASIAVDGVFRAQLGAGLVTRNNSCNATGTGRCSFSGDDRVRWGGTLQPGEVVLIDYQVQVTPGAVTGAALCIGSTFELNNVTTASVQACTNVNCPILGTGGDPPSGAVVNSNRPGSVLFFPYYSSNLTRLPQENTRLTITNTDGARNVTLHLFFIAADDCRVADTFLCLTANQTTSLLASEYDPGERGFLVVVAVDGRTGCPIHFNALLGGAYVKLASGHASHLSAFSIAAMPGGPMACDPGDATARLDFDGNDYTMVPRVLAVDNIQSPLDGNNTLLILDRIGGNYSTGTATRLSDLQGLIYDEGERSYSFQFDPSGCQYVQRIFDGAPRISPPLTKVLSAGRTGWMRIQHVANSAMFGAVINLNPNGFNHGHTLHALSYTDASITIPILPPPCGQ